MSNVNVPVQLSDIWNTRPSRIPHGGPVAGVAAGVARRYDVDPVLIRVAFVVSTIFGGAGLVLYLVLWVSSKPSEAQATTTEHGGRPQGTKWILWIALAIAGASAFGSAGVGFGGSGALSMAAMLGGVWLLHQRRPLPPVENAAMPAENAAMSAAPYAKESVPPSWDPLGAAPFAWDLPEPGAPASPPRPPRKRVSRWTSSFIGLALLAAAIATAAGSVTGNEWFTAARIGAIALVVVAIGLVVGAFLRKGFGLLVAAAPLVGFVIVASVAGPLSMNDPHTGDLLVTPPNAGALQSSYNNAVGDMDIDLRGVTLTSNRKLLLHNRIGDITVTVPATMNVADTCTSRVGNVNCLPGGVARGTDDANNFVLTIDAQNDLGDVTVHRG